MPELPALVTFEQACEHLKLIYINAEGEKVYDGEENKLIVTYIYAASNYVRNYCGQQFATLNESDPDNPVYELNCPEDVKQAVLLLIGHYYKDREQFANSAVNEYPTVIRLLDLNRDNYGV